MHTRNKREKELHIQTSVVLKKMWWTENKVKGKANRE